MYKKYEEKLDKERYEKEKAFIHENRNKMERCPYCNSSIKDRKIASWKGLIDVLYKVYCWCGKNRKHEFHMKDIRHFMSKSEYACFNIFVRFGGIVYRPKVDGKSEKALYGMNMVRAKEFFKGERDIPLQITLDQMTGEIVHEVRGKVGDFPELSSLLKANGLYDYEMDVQAPLFINNQ